MRCIRFKPLRLFVILLGCLGVWFVFFISHQHEGDGASQPSDWSELEAVIDEPKILSTAKSNVVEQTEVVEIKQPSSNWITATKRSPLTAPNSLHPFFGSPTQWTPHQTLIVESPIKLNMAKMSENIDIVVAVQVHNRIHYLEYLIESLGHVQSWENAVLIFSHDFYNPLIDSLIRSINFAPVFQFYYPFSAQIFNTSFPGTSPDDCPRDLPNAKFSCRNVKFPDKYKHYREAAIVQVKHHWLWKLSTCFEDLADYIPLGSTLSKDFRVLLLEEDYFVTPDILLTLKGLIEATQSKSVSPKLQAGKALNDFKPELLALGHYTYRLGDYAKFGNNYNTNSWVSSRYNMGMVLDSTFWNHFKDSCAAEAFCSFEDYNWDWTLQSIGMKCWPDRLPVAYPVATRVYHIGECPHEQDEQGLHVKFQKTKKCVAQKRVQEIRDQLTLQAANLLTPSNTKLTVQPNIFQKQLVPKANGGWSDPRDKRLCMGFFGKMVEPGATPKERRAALWDLLSLIQTSPIDTIFH